MRKRGAGAYLYCVEPELELWAREALTTRKTLRTLLGTATADALNPAVAVSVAAARVFRPDTPVEIFCDFAPSNAKRSRLLPVAGGLGHYSAEERTVRVYPRIIAAAAGPKFRCTAEELELIVRVHLYARAILHAATSADNDRAQLAEYPAGGGTDWAQFVDHRTAAYTGLNPALAGFLANAIAWKVVRNLKKRSRLRGVFRRVMRRQPEDERLSTELLRRIDSRTDLAPVLEYVQGEYECPHLGTFDLRARVEALLDQCARPHRSPTLSRYAAADLRSRPDAAIRGPAAAGD